MKNLCNFLISLREEYLAKRACEKHMLEAKESYRTVVFASVSWVRPSREIPVKLSAWKIFSVIFLPFTYTIYTLIIHKSMQEAIQREKPQIVVLQHNTPIFQRESYSSLVRNHCSLFSFPLPLSYLERRFVLKHNPHIFKVQRVFWSLGSFRNLPKEANEAQRMQSGVFARSGKLVKTILREVRWQQELGGLKYSGQTKLGGSFIIRVLQLYSLVDRFRLERSQRGFSLSSSVSYSITCLCVILCLHLSSLTLVDANLNRHALRPNKQYWNDVNLNRHALRPNKNIGILAHEAKIRILIENPDPTFIVKREPKV